MKYVLQGERYNEEECNYDTTCDTYRCATEHPFYGNVNFPIINRGLSMELLQLWTPQLTIKKRVLLDTQRCVTGSIILIYPSFHARDFLY